MRRFKPGARVRVEIDARIVQQAEPTNPYWYIVEYADKRRELVNIARINWLADEPIVTIDNDGSIQVISNRLTPTGARGLMQWLQIHEPDFLEQIAAEDGQEQKQDCEGDHDE